jgi:hypothetical protein
VILGIRPYPSGLDPASTQPRRPAQFNGKGRTVWHGALGHFVVSSPTMPWCPGMAGHSQGTSLQSIQQESTKHHLKAPRRLGLLSPYKRAGQGSTQEEGKRVNEQKNGANEQNKDNKPPDRTTTNKRSTSRAIIFFLFFLSLRLGPDTLSRTLVTPTQAPRCKEIQTSPPAGLRAFFCPNQDKPPCVLLASPSRKETHSIYSLV